MSTTAEEKVAAMEFIAPILEAQMRFDQAIQNQLTDAAWEAAETWAERFRALFEAVELVNRDIPVGRVLDHHWSPDIDRQISHYRRMRGIEDGDVR
jgi:hypothetical protein